MKITSITSGNEPVEAAYPELSDREAYLSMSIPGMPQDMPVRLFFLPEAVEQLFRFICWDERQARNRVEQAGILYGMTYRLPALPEAAPAACDAADEAAPPGEPESAPPGEQEACRPLPPGFTWSVVHGVIPAQAGNSTPVRVSIAADEWQRMAVTLDQLNRERAQRGEGELQQVGWFHTHPGRLDPFYSDLDVTLQRVQADNEDRYGAVFNPHRRIFMVYSGPDSRPERGALLLTREQVQRFNMTGIEKNDPCLDQDETVVRMKKRAPPAPRGGDDRAWAAQDAPGEGAAPRRFTPAVARTQNYREGRWVPYAPRNSILMTSVERLCAIHEAFGMNTDLGIMAMWRRDPERGYHLLPMMAWRRPAIQPGGMAERPQGYCLVRFVAHADVPRAAREHQRRHACGDDMMLVMITERMEVYTA